MRYLFVIAMIAAMALLAGCGTDSPDAITGSADLTAASTQADLTAAPPDPQNPEITPAVFGTTSNVNLAAGTFTVTTLDGQTYDITLTAQTLVLYQGGTTELASSVLVDGLTVTVVGSPIGLPEQAKVRASIVIINRSESNQGYLEGNA